MRVENVDYIWTDYGRRTPLVELDQPTQISRRKDTRVIRANNNANPSVIDLIRD